MVPSSRGAAELRVHVLGGRVERRMHLRRALPLEVWMSESVCGSKRRGEVLHLVCSLYPQNIV